MEKDSLAVKMLTQILLRTIYFIIGVGVGLFFLVRIHRYGDLDGVVFLGMLLLSGILGAAFGPTLYSLEVMTGRGKLKEIRKNSRYRIRRKKEPRQ